MRAASVCQAVNSSSRHLVSHTHIDVVDVVVVAAVQQRVRLLVVVKALLRLGVLTHLVCGGRQPDGEGESARCHIPRVCVCNLRFHGQLPANHQSRASARIPAPAHVQTIASPACACFCRMQNVCESPSHLNPVPAFLTLQALHLHLIRQVSLLALIILVLALLALLVLILVVLLHLIKVHEVIVLLILALRTLGVAPVAPAAPPALRQQLLSQGKDEGGTAVKSARRARHAAYTADAAATRCGHRHPVCATTCATHVPNPNPPLATLPDPTCTPTQTHTNPTRPHPHPSPTPAHIFTPTSSRPHLPAHILTPTSPPRPHLVVVLVLVLLVRGAHVARAHALHGLVDTADEHVHHVAAAPPTHGPQRRRPRLRTHLVVGAAARRRVALSGQERSAEGLHL